MADNKHHSAASGRNKSPQRRSGTTSGKDRSGTKTSSSRSSSSQRTAGKNTASARRRSVPNDDMLVLKLLLLVAAVLVIFEGRLITTMFSVSHEPVIVGSSPDDETTARTASAEKQNNADLKDENDAGEASADEALSVDAQPADTAPGGEEDASSSGASTSADGAALAGFTGEDTAASVPASDTDSTVTSSDSSSIYDENGYVISERIDDPKVVPLQAASVDDSYFSDAVFIGDSRMEGFHYTSGITQGDWLTSVGMTLTSISDSKVSTPDGTITVYQGLSGRQYKKIYLMLGANDLGFWPWEEFLPTAISVLKQFHELQPSAQIYVCSCIYVEESKVVTDYVNNANVIQVNEGLLEACRELDYCWYLNLNEVLSSGWQSLIQDASEDGVHLYEYYSKVMLTYMKNHYLTGTEQASSPAKEETEKADTSDNEDASASDDAGGDTDAGSNTDAGTSDGAAEDNGADAPEPPPDDNEVNGIVIVS